MSGRVEAGLKVESAIGKFSRIFFEILDEVGRWVGCVCARMRS